MSLIVTVGRQTLMDVIVHDDLFVMMNDASALRAAPSIGTALKVRLYNI
jgi:hypothetical protein